MLRLQFSGFLSHSKRHWWAWLLIAIGSHVLGLWLLGRSWPKPEQIAEQQPSVVWLESLPEKSAPSKPLPKRSKANEPTPAPPAKLEPMPQGQVVEIAPPQEQRVPRESKFLAEWDQDVAKETKARESSLKSPVTTPMPLPELAKPARPNLSAPPPPSPAPQVKAQAAPSLVDGMGSAKPQAGEQAEPTQDAGPPVPVPSLSQLMPSLSALLAPQGGAPFADHVDDVEIGTGTFLRTRQFRHASFFNRLKRQIGQYWPSPQLAWKLRTMAEAWDGSSKRTVVSVGLNRRGELVRLAVTQSSGIAPLDEDALAAFRQAEPFPNPPEQLFDAHGNLYFEFTFVMGHSI